MFASKANAAGNRNLVWQAHGFHLTTFDQVDAQVTELFSPWPVRPEDLQRNECGTYAGYPCNPVSSGGTAWEA